MKELTEDDKHMLRFYWEERRDITRYWDFEELIPALEENCPEVMVAWRNYQASIRTMDAVVKSF